MRSCRQIVKIGLTELYATLSSLADSAAAISINPIRFCKKQYGVVLRLQYLPSTAALQQVLGE